MFDFSSELLSRLELYRNINYRSHISKTYHCSVKCQQSETTCNILETIIWNDQKISLQWPHIGIMPSQITGSLTLYSGQLQIQQNFALFHFYCAGNPLFNSGSPSQRASNVESMFMAWHCHVFQMAHKICQDLHCSKGWYHTWCDWYTMGFITLRSEQSDGHIADDISKCNFLNGDVCILIEISIKFIPQGPNDKKLSLV